MTTQDQDPLSAVAEQSTGTKPVAESHRFDESRLAAWLEANVEG